MGDCVGSDDDYCQDYDDYSYNSDFDDYSYDCDDDPIDGLQSDSEIAAANTNSPSCKVITKESILAAQREDIRRVMDFLSLKEYQARCLLIYHRWDVDRVLQLFIENGKDKLYAEAGVIIMDHSNEFNLSQLSSVVGCTICFEDVSAMEVTAMDCGHFFCNSCWTQHFTVKIIEGQSRRIRCMEPKCIAVCDDAKIRKLIYASDPDLVEKFDRYLFESYVEDNKRVKWCPSVPHCGNAVQVEDDILSEVECACGKQFCFNCLSDMHSPCSCMMWELWSKKCRDGSETVNWITVHTKPCPKCGKAVEKNGGCNLVCCVCGQPFCWLCGGATRAEHTWTTIVNHSCGRYKNGGVRKVELAKRCLNRYIHYHNRFRAHLESLKLESKLRETVEAKISALEVRESKSKDFSYIMNALSILFRSRQILSATYAFAFYMFGDELLKDEMTDKEKELKKNLFENQQQLFEGNVERLSLFLNEQFDNYEEDAIRDLRMRIIAVSGSTETLCRNLYDCIENDLLGSVKGSFHRIAPYKSRRVLRSSQA